MIRWQVRRDPMRKYMAAQLKDYETKLLSRSWYQKLLDWVRGY